MCVKVLRAEAGNILTINASHQQPAAPRSVSTAGVLLRTAASVREAGEAVTVPVV